MSRRNRFSRRDFLKLSGAAGVGAAAFGGPLMPFLAHRMANAQDSEPLRAAMSSAGLAGSWNAQGQDAALYWGELLNVEIEWFDGEFDPVAQRAAFDQVATQEWDFVAVQPNTIGVLVDPIQSLIDAGTPVIGMDTLIAPLADLQEMGVLSFIAPDNVFLSEAVMARVIQEMGGAGKIAHIGGQPGHTGAQARGQGFLNQVSQFPDIEVVDDQPADWNVSIAADIAESVLNRHPDLAGLFADNDDMALAARQVIDEAGLGDQVVVGGVDAMPSAIEAVADGRLLATTRNSSTRIHGWSVVAGAFAATAGLDAAREQLPFFVLADGPLITAEIDDNPDFADEPWKRKNYGFSTIPGQLWLEEQFLF